MVKLLLIAIGFGTSFIAVREVILSIRRGSFRARGGRTIKRSDHPIMFWLNFGGLAIVFILGLLLRRTTHVRFLTHRAGSPPVPVRTIQHISSATRLTANV